MTLANKLAIALSLAALTGAWAGCDQGNEDKCRAAIRNVLHVTDQDNSEAVDEDAFIRSCRANSSPKAIKCLTEAKTVEDLEKCEGGLADKMSKKDKAAKDGDGKPEGETE